MGGAEGRYRTIVVDPPWAYDQSWARGRWLVYQDSNEGADGAYRKGRGAVANYRVMDIAALRRLPINEWAEDAAHLYIWTTNQFMVEAHDLANAWAFQVKTILTWVKARIGMGTYYRNNTEHVVFATKGGLKVLRHDVQTAFRGKQGHHSEKPAAFYDMVESMSPGPYLDVFARKLRFNWDGWGDEVGAPPGLPTPDEVRALTAPAAPEGMEKLL